MDSEMIDVGGHQVAAHIAAGGQPTVVFVSAMGQGADDWIPVIDCMATRPATVRYDRPAIGQSPPRPTPNIALPYSRFAGELTAMLDQLEVAGPVVLVAHSFGSLIAQTFAGRHPDRVAGAVFVDGSMPGMDLGEEGVPRIDGDDDTGNLIDTKTGAEEIAASIVPQVPAVVLSRTWGWWKPEFGPQAPHHDARWHGYHAELAGRWGAPRLVAGDSGHQMPAEVPALVALAVDLVVGAVREGRRSVLVDAGRVAAAGGTVADD
jgi:pimeloyl-ACP methyl ester carboxylesterase